MSKNASSLYQSGDHEAAKKIWSAVLAEDDGHPGSLHGMGVIARDMEQYEIGAELIRRALLRDSTNASMYNNLGTLFEQWDRYDDAIKAYRTGLRHAPRNHALYNNLGSCFAHMGRRSDALRAFQKALDLGGGELDLITNYAATLSDVGHFARAEPYFKQALEVAEPHSYAHFVYGTALQRQGRWAEAWPLYEARLQRTETSLGGRRFPQPSWDGSGEGYKVVLWGEQGIGDEIRFASMIPDALGTGAEIAVECEPRLVDLFRRSFPAARIEAAPFLRAETGEESFDFAAPMGALGGLFRTVADDFPSDAGYLLPCSERKKQMQDRLAVLEAQVFVGVCWRSGLRKAFRNEYYTSVSELAPLAKVPGLTFVNLQYDAAPEEIREFESRFGMPLHHWDDLDQKNDLESAAALTACMDVVVTAATSVSCMAGALGVSTLEFRPSPVADGYLIDGHCPWFPVLRYVDKRTGEPWSTVFRKIARELEEMSGE